MEEIHRLVHGGAEHSHHPSSAQDSQPLSHQTPGEDGGDGEAGGGACSTSFISTGFTAYQPLNNRLKF